MKKSALLSLLAMSAQAKFIRGNECENVCGSTQADQYNAQCAVCVLEITMEELCSSKTVANLPTAVPGCEVILNKWSTPSDKTWIWNSFKRHDGEILSGVRSATAFDIHNDFYDNSKEHEHVYIDTRYGNGPAACETPPCTARGLAWERAHPDSLWQGGATPFEEQRKARVAGVASGGELKNYRHGGVP